LFSNLSPCSPFKERGIKGVRLIMGILKSQRK
jgi:hypothetical protein